MTENTTNPSILQRVGNVGSAIFRSAPKAVLAALCGLAEWLEGWLLDSKKATYGVAVARIGLSAAALGLLASNFSTRLYTWGAGGAWSGDIANPRSDFPHIWFLSAFQAVRENAVAFTALYLFVGVLAVLVMIGYRTRIVMPVFLILWVSLVDLQGMIGDQGDNMFRIAFIALFFTDLGKRWSLDARRRADATEDGALLVRAWKGSRILPAWMTNLSHNLAVIALACQICMVYVSGALYKAGGVSWQSGYAIYAPLHTQRFGPWPELSTLVTTWGPLVALLSVGSVFFQVIFAGALLNKWTRRMVLIAMLSFHAGIGLLLGLPWFSLTMVAVDAIFVRDVTWAGAAGWVARKSRESRRADKPDLVADDRETVTEPEDGREPQLVP
jgi:hypothetical protein